jgi:hypothetical protein
MQLVRRTAALLNNPIAFRSPRIHRSNAP